MMQSLLEGYIGQLRQGLTMGLTLPITPPQKEIRHVILVTLGGSGVEANIVQELVVDEITVPLIVTNSYQMPAFVGEHTLFIVIALGEYQPVEWAMVETALSRKALAVLVTNQTKLLEEAQNKRLVLVNVPETAPHSDFLTGYVIVQVLFLLKFQGLISDRFMPQLSAAIDLLDEREYFLQDGAENLAWSLKDKLPILYGDARFEPVLQRFVQQINAVGKHLAYVNTFPKVTYHEIEGWVYPEFLLEKTMIVMLTTRFDHPEVKKQIEASRPLIVPQSGGIAEVMLLHGDSLLEQMLYAIHLFDWTAFFLSKEHNTDPMDRPAIARLKEALNNAVK